MSLESLTQQFHIYSKVPVEPTQAQSLAVNKGGHTITYNDVWAEDLPWFGSEQFLSLDDAKTALNGKARKNDLIRIKGVLYKFSRN